jgi:hypothetical protein
MRSLIKRFEGWRQRRRVTRIAQWGLTRKKGKTRFVFRVSLIWSGFMILTTSFYHYVVHGAVDVWNIVYFSIAGPIVALVSWWVNEGEYRAAKIDARMREIREQQTLPRGDV